MKDQVREHLFRVEPNFPRCLIEKLLANQKSGPIFYQNKPNQPCLSLHMGGKILKIPLISLVPKSVSLCLSCLTSNLLKIFSLKIPDLVHRPTAAADDFQMIFTASSPRLIQSSSRNVNDKDGALKPLGMFWQNFLPSKMFYDID